MITIIIISTTLSHFRYLAQRFGSWRSDSGAGATIREIIGPVDSSSPREIVIASGLVTFFGLHLVWTRHHHCGVSGWFSACANHCKSIVVFSARLLLVGHTGNPLWCFWLVLNLCESLQIHCHILGTCPVCGTHCPSTVVFLVGPQLVRIIADPLSYSRHVFCLPFFSRTTQQPLTISRFSQTLH